MKKLYRSKTNKVLTGILGGIGEYLELDPVVVRIIFLILTCFTAFFPGILFYIVAFFIVPVKPDEVPIYTAQQPEHQAESEIDKDSE